MEMTPEQLRFLRDQRGLTREQLAIELGDCTASTINKWERGMHAIPEWVADKMFAKMPVSFTVQELAEMYELCREEACTMAELFQDSIRMRLEERRAASGGKTTSGQNLHPFPQQPQSRAAEDPAKYHDKNGTED